MPTTLTLWGEASPAAAAATASRAAVAPVRGGPWRELLASASAPRIRATTTTPMLRERIAHLCSNSMKKVATSPGVARITRSAMAVGGNGIVPSMRLTIHSEIRARPAAMKPARARLLAVHPPIVRSAGIYGRNRCARRGFTDRAGALDQD